ncbi:hypothetical protein CRUP_005981 [Coryphaenoides rupestris]|nr:hypothetical protein CRUP_005981 [Coryphaenoides rupestris]
MKLKGRSVPVLNLLFIVSVGEFHGLRVGSALLCIVAGCIIIGVSRECDADAVGGIFLGAGGLGTQSQLNLERTKSRMGTFDSLCHTACRTNH